MKEYWSIKLTYQADIRQLKDSQRLSNNLIRGKRRSIKTESKNQELKKKTYILEEAGNSPNNVIQVKALKPKGDIW